MLAIFGLLVFTNKDSLLEKFLTLLIGLIGGGGIGFGIGKNQSSKKDN